MTEEIVRRLGIEIGRRRFLRNALVTVFGLAAGLSVGQLKVLAGYCGCSGPYGSGYCGSNLCNGSECTGNSTWHCTYTYCCCGSGYACWSAPNCPGDYCCDCVCSDGFNGFYCYCYGF